MILNLSKNQYRTLVEMLTLAETKLVTFHEQNLIDDEDIAGFMAVSQHIFKHAKKMDCEDAISYYPEVKAYGASQGLQDWWSDCLIQQDHALFKAYLSKHLAMRELMLISMSQAHVTEPDLDQLDSLEAHYMKMLETSGIALLDPITEKEFSKKHSTIDVEQFIDLQVMAMTLTEAPTSHEGDQHNFDFEQSDSDNLIQFPSESALKPLKTLPNPSHTYVIKVELKGAKPPVWRRLEVADNLSLAELHQVIQTAFGLFDTHLHGFIHDFATPFDSEINEEEEAHIPLLQLLSIEGNQCLYCYDFGDNWDFVIKLEKIKPYHAETFAQSNAICTAGRRSGPIEDCGGIDAFNELAQLAKQNKLPEHYQFIYDHFGEGEDPFGNFDKDEINQTLLTKKDF